MDFLKKLFNVEIDKVIDSGFKGLDSLITSKEEQGEQTIRLEEIKAAQEKDRATQALEMERLKQAATNAVLNDKNSARNMQMAVKSIIPGLLTIVFTVAFFGLVYFILQAVFDKLDHDLPNYAVALISSVFGSVSAIMTQIASFYFGSSKGGEDQVDKMTEAMGQAAQGAAARNSDEDRLRDTGK